jgi:alpha-mannosidase
MNNQKYMAAMIEKMSDRIDAYTARSMKVICEIPVRVFCTKEHYRKGPQDADYRSISGGDVWGDEWIYGWFKFDYTVDDDTAGKNLWLIDRTNGVEGLLFVDGKHSGMFDHAPDINNLQFRVHKWQYLTREAEHGRKYEMMLESYAGHRCVGYFPEETYETGNPYPADLKRRFEGIYLGELNSKLYLFARKLKSIIQIYESADEIESIKWIAYNILENLYRILPMDPAEYTDHELEDVADKADDLAAELFRKKDESSGHGFIGMTGHTHLDTGWGWPVEETIKKAARTYSNALKLIERYPEYMFFQSSVAHTKWMEDHYPGIFEDIKKRYHEGRWEINGGSWVESDGNIPSGESLIRQFLRGQRYLREKFNDQSDCYWLPDTFGYAASIPQILKGCGIKYFLTTKLGWNDTNEFPFTTFKWRGIDGSEVLAHCNVIHTYPDISSAFSAIRGIKNKQTTLSRFVPYGFGDGGGGPHEEMIEDARIASAMRGVPDMKHTSVSGFMKKLELEAVDVPVHNGELYLEGHRGTLTSIHDMKRTNRKAEVLLRDLEIVSSAALLKGVTYDRERVNGMYEQFLLNQFHDILPGTSIPRVNDTAIQQNKEIMETCSEMIKDACDFPDKQIAVSLFNSLSWKRKDDAELKYAGKVPAGYTWQKYTDVHGKDLLITGDLDVDPFASITLEMTEDTGADNKFGSPFIVEKGKIETPFALISVNNGTLTGFYDKTACRELMKEDAFPLNSFFMGEDIPRYWDNWNIDGDQHLKMEIQKPPVSSEIVSIGPLRLVMRNTYLFGNDSKLIQDVIFHSRCPKIDFDTQIHWNEKHKLLKACFQTSVMSDTCRSEIQYGHVERNIRPNNSHDLAKFEFSNQKWTDISEQGYGYSILNDCKYGISVRENIAGLTLMKSGTHPDPRGDSGVHSLKYSFLPHQSGFGVTEVIHPAYELNHPYVISEGRTETCPPLCTVEPANIIIEAVKPAEDGDGIVIRMYECEKRHTNARISLNFDSGRIAVVNMLEDELYEINTGKNIELSFNPFEIITLKAFTNN